jgi:hypothetical protein
VFHTSHSCTSVPPAGALTAIALLELYTVQRIWGVFHVKEVERARPWRPTQKRPTSAAGSSSNSRVQYHTACASMPSNAGGRGECRALAPHPEAPHIRCRQQRAQ